MNDEERKRLYWLLEEVRRDKAVLAPSSGDAPKPYYKPEPPTPAKPPDLGATGIQKAEARSGTFFRVFTPAMNELFEKLGLKFKGGKQWWSQRDGDMHVSVHIAIPVHHFLNDSDWGEFMTKLVRLIQKAKEKQEPPKGQIGGEFPLM